MRCQHKPGCEQHQSCNCKEPSRCLCLNICGCREYANPSLTWSKEGLVLHLQWREADGTLSTIDLNFNCPSWPTPLGVEYKVCNSCNLCISCNSCISCKECGPLAYLERKMPVGWIEECSLMEGKNLAAQFPGGPFPGLWVTNKTTMDWKTMKDTINWQVKFRLINKETALSRQIVDEVNNEIMWRENLEALALLNVLKYCTDSSASDEECKSAIHRTISKNPICIEDMGDTLKLIIRCETIRGKFSSVHPDLAKLGITRVEVGKEGLHFVRGVYLRSEPGKPLLN